MLANTTMLYIIKYSKIIWTQEKLSEKSDILTPNLKNRVKSMLIKNQDVELDIIDISSEGNGVGKHEGFTVFVPFTAPGDKSG